MTKSINRPCRAVSSPRAILLKLWSPYSSSVTSVSPLWCLAAVADSPERRWKVWLIPSEEIPLRFVVPAQLRLEERNSAETRNSALAQARRSLVERLAWWWTWGTKCGAEGAQLGLLMWTTSVFFFFHLKIFRVKDGDFFLSPSRHTVWGQIRRLAGLEKITPNTRAPGSHYSMKISVTPLDVSIPFLLPKTGLWLESEVSVVTLWLILLLPGTEEGIYGPWGQAMFSEGHGPGGLEAGECLKCRLKLRGESMTGGKKTAALQERNAHGRGCTRRAAEEACVREQLQKQAVGRWQTLWEWTLEKRNSEKGKMQRQEGRWNEGCPWKQPGDEAVWGQEHLVISGCFSRCGIWSGLHHVRRT